MTIQLIGAGLGRTGTMSLKLALEHLLGGTCHHMVEVGRHPDEIPRWHAAFRGEPVGFGGLLDGYCAVVDYPGAAAWRELAETFPDAPILLSTRSSAQTWWDSASSTILVPRQPTDDVGRARRAMLTDMFARSLGDIDLSDEDAVKAAYDAHNDAVRREIPTHRLFEYQPGDGWAPLCTALGLAEPDEPFPHTNTREEFRERAGLDEPS
jgi:hypothetical protein